MFINDIKLLFFYPDIRLIHILTYYQALKFFHLKLNKAFVYKILFRKPTNNKNNDERLFLAD